MPQHSPIANRAASFATASERDLARLRASLKAAQDGVAGLSRSVRVPVPKGGRNSTRASRTSPNIFERAGISSIGGFLGTGLVDVLGLGGSFYSSGAQTASLWNNILQNGQRIM